jgi:hypothetical protein
MSTSNRFSFTAGAGVAYPADESCEEDGDEILLSGGDYWRLDSSIVNEKPPAFKNTSQRPPLASQYSRPNNNKFDPLAETMDDAEDWSRIRREESNGRELDEFVMLEKQLENMSVTHAASRPQFHAPAPAPVLTISSSRELENSQNNGSYQTINQTRNQSAASRPVVRHSNQFQSQNTQLLVDDSADEDDLEKSLVGHTQYQRERDYRGTGICNGSGEEDSDTQIRHVRPVIAHRETGNTSVNLNRSASRDRGAESGRPLSASTRPLSASIRSGGGERGGGGGGERGGGSGERGGGGGERGGGAGSSSSDHGSGNSGAETEEMRRYLTEKAKELESELATYTKENATLKKLRKEQEMLLTEKRAEVHKWALDERQKTETWCEEQKQAAARERSTSAKVARDNRLAMSATGAQGIRKERAEVEALQATLEKLKIDADAKEKKSKMNEKRLQQLAKDHSANAEDYQQQLASLERNRQDIIAYLDSIGVRLPGSLVKSIVSTGKGETGTPAVKPANLGFGSTTAPREGSVNLGLSKKTSHNLHLKAGSSRTLGGTYAVEVDPENIEVTPSVRVRRGEGNMSDTMTQRGTLASAMFHNISATPNRTRSSSTPRGATSSQDQWQISSTQRQSSTTIRESMDRERGQTQSSMRDVLGIDNDLKASWARSSRSSRGSRYSDDNDHSDEGTDLGRDTGRGRDTAVAAVHDHSSLGLANTVRASQITGIDGLRTSTRAIGVDSSTAKAADSSSLGRSMGRTADSQNKIDASNPPPYSDLGRSSIRLSTNEIMASKQTPEGGANGGSRTEEVLPDGRRLISYRNGTRKEILPNGESLVRFVNGDSKTTGAGNSGVVVYYYAQADTTHTTYKDGLEVYEFPNRQVCSARIRTLNFSSPLSSSSDSLMPSISSVIQVEKHYRNGTKEILFPDQTRKLIYADGIQESFFPDGVVVRELPDGTREITKASP